VIHQVCDVAHKKTDSRPQPGRIMQKLLQQLEKQIPRGLKPTRDDNISVVALPRARRAAVPNRHG
jgi:hypothetical protein